MSQRLPLKPVSEAAERFLAELRDRSPHRFEAKVSSADGMPLLCAVEAVLYQALPSSTAQELVWVNGAPKSGAHLLHLRAFGPDNALLAEAHHEFAA